MEPSSSISQICPNCNNTYDGKFCSNCGQRAGVKKLSVKEVFAEIPRSLLFIESRFQNTIKSFFKDPIYLTQQYSVGKRRTYGSPVQFFYFFASLYLILKSLFSFWLYGPTEEDLTNLDDIGIFDRFFNAADLLVSLTDTIYFSITIPIFLGIIVFAFQRSRLNFAESIAFAFFYYTFIQLIWILDELIKLISYPLDLYLTLEFWGLPEAIILGFLFSRSAKGGKFRAFMGGFIAHYLSISLILISAFFFSIIAVYVQ